MGNFFSNGNNYEFDEKGNVIQTPLNKFIEKVMNEKYFFSPNVNDNMINEVDKTDINNKQVLLKRALCTGTTYVPISLPYVPSNKNGDVIKEGNFTLRINATDKDGKKLPNIEDITGENYNKAHARASEIFNNPSMTEDSIKKDTQDNNDARKVLEYLRIQNSLDDGSGLNYRTTVEGNKSNARVGNTVGCKNFYIGKNPTDDTINYERNKGYNDFDENNLPTSDGFCGKVFQYNNLIKKNIENKINGVDVDDLIGDNTRKDNGSLTYRQNEFIDCNCLNSELIVEYNSNINLKEEIINNAGQISELDPYIESQEVAQNNIAMCKTNLHTGLGAYAFKNRKQDYDLTLCQSVKYIDNVDVNAESILNLVQKCNIKTDNNKNTNSYDDTKMNDNNSPISNSLSSNNKNNEKKNNNTIIIIIVFVVLGIILIVIILFAISRYKSDNTNSGKSQTSEMIPNSKFYKQKSLPV